MTASSAVKIHSIPFWLRKLHHNLLDLDTTIAYDEAELDAVPEDIPPLPASLAFPESEKAGKGPKWWPLWGYFPLINTCWPRFQHLNTGIQWSNSRKLLFLCSCKIVLIWILPLTTPRIYHVKDELPSPNSSLSDHQDKDASDLLLVEDDLGLDSLFKEVLHVHAQKPQVPRQPKRDPSRSPKSVFQKPCRVNLQGRKTKKTTFISEGLCMLI